MNGTDGPRRVCILERGTDGFGFVLCCENDTTDTFVLRVIDNSPAAEAGLKPGDRIIEINEINVENEKHTDVVKILQGLKNIRLVVKFNKEASDYFMRSDNGMTVHPLPSVAETRLRPKLVRIRRGLGGYDFVVKTIGKSPRVCTGKYRQIMKGVTGHFVESVQKGGQAFDAGLRLGERIVEINKINVEKESHAFVIAAIRTSPHRILELLVVDKATDDFFGRHCVSPTYRHLYGDLNFSEVIDKSNYDISDGDMSPSISPYSSRIESTAASSPASQRSQRLQAGALSVEDLSLKTEDLIKELRMHSSEITRLKSSLGYSRSFVEPSFRDKYLNIVTRDTSSNPGSPHFQRHMEYTSTTSSSDDDHSLFSNNNHRTLKYEPPRPQPKPVENLSDAGFNVDLKTLKEHSRRQIEKKRSENRGKAGYDNYWVAHRAVNNM